MSHPTVKELREWLDAWKPDVGGRERLPRLSLTMVDRLQRLSAAYRDMAIKAGEWPCKCGGEQVEYLEFTGMTKTISCSNCPEYRPEEL